jgi:Xaa-Pro aminopeptidase
MAVFPKGTKGIQLDAFARKPLWDSRCDYGHGTGHGVGFFLNVHEGPHSISHTKGPLVDLTPGMICTIEPGYYKKDQYGIRIENIVLIAGDEDEEDDEYEDDEHIPFYYFKILTLCPIDITLINPSLLTPGEREFLNTYHKKVRDTLSPFLDDDCVWWLEKATRPV